MAKRFTDTEIWDKEWFTKLSLKEKCLVRYIFDKCDNAGIWAPNWPIASAYLGETVTLEDLTNFGSRLDFIGEKVFVIDFIDFQYGKLTEDCKPHRPIIQKLKKYGLYERVMKGYCNPSERVEEKEEEKDQDKEPEKDEGGVEEINPIPVVVEMKTIWLELKPDYPQVKNSTDDEQALFAIGDFIAQQFKIPWLPHSTEERVFVVTKWRALANWILADDFYRSWALITLSSTKSMKTIWQKSNDGTTQKTSGKLSNGKQNIGHVPTGGFGFNDRR